ncbi:MotB family protein [Roseibium sp.]|uniref:MotB family protein n=1 Tax=Roseibium sp. TaxID=1936156 RepID=UPI003A97F4CA
MQDIQPSEIVIVRRKPAWDEENEQHGVWKIAYADFMTAMMAFFLVMWLINVTDDSIRRGVAQYFNPVKLASTAPNQKGLNDPNVMGETNEDGAEEPEGDLGPGRQLQKGDVGAGQANQDVPGRFAATQSEERLFNDPYAVLDTLAQTIAVDLGDEDMPTAIGAGQAREAGAQGGDAYRDPFDPLYWQFLPNRDLGSLRTENEPVPSRSVATGFDESLSRDSEIGARNDAAGLLEAEESAIVAHFEGADPLVEEIGGQADSTTAAGKADETGNGDQLDLQQVEKPTVLASGETDAGEARGGAFIAGRLESILQDATRKGLGETAARVSIEQSDEGVLISLTDDQAFGMFAIGSAEPRPELVKLLERVGSELKEVGGEIVIKGHTDARPFKTKRYDNWRLSSARAHMALYMLTRGGVTADRFSRVEGYADRDLKTPADPYAAANRRVEILIREQSQ